MAFVLHLTDLHLGGHGDGQEMDDHKVKLIPEGERISRTVIIRNTLRQLGVLCEQGSESLDAVVVSGDITIRNDPRGYAEFSSVLEELGDQLPDPGRILVVPGNHDVAWDTPPSSTERYANFVEYVRKKGFVTPLLDGVDSANGPSDKNLMSLDGGAIEVVAINSSNYCGTRDVTSIPTAGSTTSAGGSANSKPIDLARISPWQLKAWGTYLSHKDLSIGAPPASNLRIAVLHHQLAPVTPREELKAFESLVNLGAFRYFLRAHAFHAVLHGHKHASAIYWDYISPSGQLGTHPPIAHKILVISGATVIQGSNQTDVARLVNFIPGNAPRCEIRLLEGVEPGARTSFTTNVTFPLWTGSDYQGVGTHNVVIGRNVDEVYERLLLLVDDRAAHGILHDVYSAIEPAPDELHLPNAYPIPESYSGSRDAWLREQVDWWQRPTSRLAVPFTHGGRIFRYGATNLNQLETCIRVLKKKVETSRAFICLYDPSLDARERIKPKAPHFASMQFWIDSEEGWPRLNCIGYFRKQEIRYWWAVNVGELSRLQNLVYKAVSSAVAGLRLGKLATFTSIMYAGSGSPRVAVPLIDRLFDQNSDAWWELAHALAYPPPNRRLEFRRRWDLVLDDLIPEPEPDPNSVPLPVVGLSELREEVDRLSRFGHDQRLAAISELLTVLRDANVSYGRTLDKQDPVSAIHKAWALRCEEVVAKLRNQIHQILQPNDGVA